MTPNLCGVWHGQGRTRVWMSPWMSPAELVRGPGVLGVLPVLNSIGSSMGTAFIAAASPCQPWAGGGLGRFAQY